MKKAYWVGGLLAALAIGGIFFYWQWLTSPQYSIWQAKKALENHDLTAFERYVDIEGVTDGVVDQVLQDKGLVPKEDANPWEQLGQELAQKMMATLKPQLVKLVKEEVAYYVEKGSVEEGNGESQKSEEKFSQFSLGDWPKKVLTPKGKFQGIEYVRQEEGLAFIGLKFLPEESNQSLILELKMADRGHYWQVISVTNFIDILNKLEEIKK